MNFNRFLLIFILIFPGYLFAGTNSADVVPNAETKPEILGFGSTTKNTITYPQSPSASSQPIPPKSCNAPQVMTNVVQGPTKSLKQVGSTCTSYGCPACTGINAANPVCLAQWGICESCEKAAGFFGSNCGGTCLASTPTYGWTAIPPGPIAITEVDCQAPTFVPSP